MPIEHRDIATLPVDERGHKQIHRAGHLSGEQTGFVKDDAAPGTAVEWMNPVHIYNGAFNCDVCNAFPSFSVETDAAGNPVLLVAATACEFTAGISMVIELAVPSGKMIVTDSLMPVFDFDLLNYNSKVGQAEAQSIMAAQGCAFGPIGNSSPSLVRTGDGTFMISDVDDELESGDDGYVEGEVLAEICTDLWAYSIADLDHFVAVARAKYAAANADERKDLLRRELIGWAIQPGDPRERLDQLGWTVTVVDVVPGTYRFIHHTGETDFDFDAWPAVYAHIERVE